MRIATFGARSVVVRGRGPDTIVTKLGPRLVEAGSEVMADPTVLPEFCGPCIRDPRIRDDDTWDTFARDHDRSFRWVAAEVGEHAVPF